MLAVSSLLLSLFLFFWQAPPPALATNEENFFEKILEWVFFLGGEREKSGTLDSTSPSPSVIPGSIRDPSSDSDSELSVPTKTRGVVKYILDLGDSIVSSVKITDDTITSDDLASILRFKDGDYIDLSTISPTGNDMGLKLPQSNDCSKITDEGLICWDRDDNVLTIGTGDSRSQFYGFGPSIDSSEITNGTVSFDDMANDSMLDATTTWTLGTNNLILNLSSTGDFIVQDNGTAFATFSDSGVVTFAHLGLRLTDKGSTGDPSTCTAGDVYFNATDATMKGCTASNTWEVLDDGTKLYKTSTEVTATGAGAVGNNAATLSTISGISIPAGSLVRVTFQMRKSAGAAANSRFGFKVNSTLVYNSNSDFMGTSATNEIQAGNAHISFTVPDASYPTTTGKSPIRDFFVEGATGSNSGNPNYGSSDNAIPNGPITSITITGDAGNSAITIATKNLIVEVIEP